MTCVAGADARRPALEASLMVISLVAKAAPMVAWWRSRNSFLVKRNTREDLPTATSPRRTTW
jgi:hypothetical protein